MPITELPVLNRTDPTFKSDVDTFFGSQLPTFSTEVNTEINRINQIGFGSYTATSSSSLTVGTGAKSFTIDVGKSFGVGQAVLIARTSSPTTTYMGGQVTSYNANTGAITVNVATSSGSGTFADWTVTVSSVVSASNSIPRLTKTSAYTLATSDSNSIIDCSGTWTLSVTAAATLGAGWWCYVRNAGNGDITIDPSGAELIDGASTLVMKPGFIYLLQCDGVGMTTITVKRRTYERRSLITVSGTFTVPEDCFVIRAYAFGAGGNPVGGNGGGGGGCAYGDIAVTPGQVVTLGIASGVATVTASSVALLTANPASGTTGGTASKHASVTNGGAYSGGTNSGGFTAGASSGSPVGNGFRGGLYGGAGWGGAGGNIVTTAGSGGGAAGAASPSMQVGGPGFDPVIKPIDPLLADLTGAGGAQAAPGGPGGGGGGGGGTLPGGDGGFGGGGGGTGLASARGGDGGFGGGGGHCSGTSGIGGNGGYGGGGGYGAGTNGTGGPAAIIIIY